ncbi:DUF2523 domain-containing protein [Proteus mirabilis]|uniref:DUF2523 family protein n=1 Tax=Proteus mirabilis TaxID=584 RepID=UPI0019D03873|nr:DUF2523 family protein [Proteus mirabilis]MBI6486509.1 DUF2523 domain-containing protein [Proteus mirabilis]MBN7151015.1 DUF2523 domain-containing protein [Proteus mirabilis]MBN7154568.1 DUF2523 domain-containing protein [Proteus mirabilis]MBN7167331.1 DUF2523 domain-containing protein [Proteus mirabilis]MBN7171029.1 DUF2523 domain-containing protein [Proteus mirabilis]
MWGLLSSAFNGTFAILLRELTIKFVVFTALTVLIASIMNVVIDFMPSETNIVELFELLPDSAWYFINLAELPLAIQIIFTAIATRFIFGMIPVVGH